MAVLKCISLHWLDQKRCSRKN